MFEERRSEARSAPREGGHEESVSNDQELSRAEEEQKRKLVEIENDDDPRGCDAGRQVKRRNQDEQPHQGTDHTGEYSRDTKSKQEVEGEREDAKR